MRGIRFAALAGCVLPALVVVGGAAAESGPGKGGDPGKLGAAIKTCQSQGLKPGTDAFRQCLKGQLGGGGGGQNGGGTGATGPGAKVVAAAKACQAQGVKAGTGEF